MSKSFWAVLLLIVGVLMLLFGIGTILQHAHEDDAARHRLHVALDSIAAVKRDMAIQQQASARKDSTIRQLTTRADTLRARADRIHTVIVRVPVPDSADHSNPHWQPLYYAARSEADTLRAANDTLRDAFALLGADRDRWKLLAVRSERAGDSVTVVLPAVERCRVVWILACPSRRTTLVIGAIAGAATGAWVHSKVARPKR